MVTEYLAKGLIDKGHNVTVVTSSVDGSSNEEDYCGIKIECTVGSTGNSISEVLFDGTKTTWTMNKTCIGTKAYQKETTDQCLMSLGFYLYDSLRLTASIG